LSPEEFALFLDWHAHDARGEEALFPENLRRRAHQVVGRLVEFTIAHEFVKDEPLIEQDRSGAWGGTRGDGVETLASVGSVEVHKDNMVFRHAGNPKYSENPALRQPNFPLIHGDLRYTYARPDLRIFNVWLLLEDSNQDFPLIAAESKRPLTAVPKYPLVVAALQDTQLERLRYLPGMQPGDAMVFETSGPNMCFHAGIEREVRNGGTRRSIDFRVRVCIPHCLSDPSNLVCTIEL